MTVVFYTEAPTGSIRRQLGSGLTDYWLYGVLQKSLTKRDFTEKLQLGVEVFGGVANNFNLGRGQLQAQIGGSYSVRDDLAFTFGVLGGHFPASPRAGLQVGLTCDFE